MNRRLSIIILCIFLSLLLPGCKSYTASQGKTVIEPIVPPEGERIITKYSLIQEKEEVLLKEKALKEEKAKALLVAQQQAERDAQLASLLTKEEELQSDLERLNSRLTNAIEENQQLRDTITELTYAKDEITLGTQLSTQESTERLLSLQKKNALLTDEIVELHKLIEENRRVQEEQQQERERIEQEQAALLVEEKRQNTSILEELKAECDALRVEARMLKTQLEQKTLTIEEKNRLELERSEEAKRQELLQRQQAQALEAEKRRIASQEEAKELARQKEWEQIPPLDKITFPRLYKTEKPTTFITAGKKLSALMLPLDDAPWKNPSVVKEVHKSISDLEIPIIFVTGHRENVIALVKEMRSNAALFSTGAIITSFPIEALESYSALVEYQEGKNLRLIVANLPEYQVIQQFIEEKDWQAIQKRLAPERITLLKQMIGEGELTTATLLGASLYEPSNKDWNTFSPVAYRQIDYLWPLSDHLESEGFYDIYRLTHFSESTSAGNTLIAPAWGERIDYLYSRKILPLASTMVTIGGESAPDEAGISRFGVLATFLVP